MFPQEGPVALAGSSCVCLWSVTVDCDLPDFAKPEQASPTWAVARIVMVNDKGQPTRKKEDCYMWTREQYGFGWRYTREEPVPEF